MDKKISIILSTYNEAPFVVQTINEILSNIKNVEIILVDDNSPDGTLEKVKNIGNPNIKINKTLIISPEKDHRIAMAFFCLGQLLNGRVRINNFQTVNTSFAKFLFTMKKIGATFEIKKQN